jgi:hypothetical protein
MHGKTENPLRNRRRRFVARERDRPLEAPRPGDEDRDAARERVRGDPGFERLRAASHGTWRCSSVAITRSTGAENGSWRQLLAGRRFC